MATAPTPLTCLYQFVAGLGVNTAFESVKWITKNFKTHGSYWLCYQKKIKMFKESMEKKLRPCRNDLQRQVDADDMAGEVINETVEKWLTEVDRLEKDLRDLQDMIHANCKSRYNLGKKASENLDSVEKLLAERSEFRTTGISQPAPPPGFLAMPANRGFKEFGSTKAAKNSIMAALWDDQVHLIGIYGMGGVGKTTLMDEIGRTLEKDKIFNKVVKVVVSQNPKLDQVRLDIAQELGLKLLDQVSGTTTGDSAARKLAERLRKDKSRILIMLDDVWEKLELRSIGIPADDDDCKNCTILFTSRSFEVCNTMKADRTVQVKVLSEEDSWELFKITVGTAIVESADIEPVARKVAQECGGLPLALVVVGGALRSGYNERSLWEDVWNQLKHSSPDNLEGVESHLFKSLQVSYDRLSSRDLKSVFLYCCLFREDYDIGEEELVRYMTGERFLEGVTSLNEMRGRVHRLLKKLKDLCLLLDSSKYGCVKMHDVVRDVAIYIASRNEDCFYVKAGIGLQDWPENNSDHLNKCQRISFANNFFTTLHGVQPECPKLLTLLLNTNTNLCQVPDDFFIYMPSIRILDLSKTEIAALPSSITCLVNLGTLCLDSCYKLNEISSLAKLKTLRVLSIQKCKATAFLPEVLGSLIDLKLLDLSFSTLKIPTDLIARLSRLEELYLTGCLVKESSLLAEIATLNRLRRLQVCVQDHGCFSQDFCGVDNVQSVWKNLTDFFISSRHDDYSMSIDVFKRKIYLCEVGPDMATWVKTLLQKSEEIFMYECMQEQGIEPHHLFNLAELDGCQGFPNTKKLVLSTCPTVQYLLSQNINGSSIAEIPSNNAYKCLEILELKNLGMLKGISCCNSDSATQQRPTNFTMSFTKLKKLSIEHCHSLSGSVMSLEMMKRVNPSLESLFVHNCQQVEVIFQLEGFDQLEDNFVALPRLKILILISLPSLVNICNGVTLAGGLENIESIEVAHCRKLSSLFYSSNRTLASLRSLATLKKLVVSSCDSLRQLFKTSLANNLQSLESLELKNNKAIEELIEGEEGTILDTCSFPCLKHLILQNCPRLEVFYPIELSTITKDLKFPSLTSMKIEECLLLKKIPFGNESAPSLQEIDLPDYEDKEWFQQLQWSDDKIPERLRGCIK